MPPRALAGMVSSPVQQSSTSERDSWDRASISRAAARALRPRQPNSHPQASAQLASNSPSPEEPAALLAVDPSAALLFLGHPYDPLVVSEPCTARLHNRTSTIPPSLATFRDQPCSCSPCHSSSNSSPANKGRLSCGKQPKSFVNRIQPKQRRLQLDRVLYEQH